MDTQRLLIEVKHLPLLVVPASDGRRALSDFANESLDISSSFREVHVDDPGPSKVKMLAGYYSLERDASVLDAYHALGGDLFSYAFTPQQLGEFIVQNREMIHQIKRSTFFLLLLDGRITAGIYVPHESHYLAVRSYILDSVYVVRASDHYLFLAPKF